MNKRMEKKMPYALSKLSLALIFIALIISKVYSSDFERESVNENNFSQKYAPSKIINIPNSLPRKNGINLLEESHIESNNLEIESQKKILMEKGMEEIKKHTMSCYKNIYNVCASEKELRLYIWAINLLATDGETEEKTLKNYKKAAKHLRKIKLILGASETVTKIEYLPEFSDEIDLNEKINSKLCNFLEKQFRESLPRDSNLSIPSNFITDFLKKEEITPIYNRIEPEYRTKIIFILEECISQRHSKNLEEMDFSECFL